MKSTDVCLVASEADVNEFVVSVETGERVLVSYSSVMILVDDSELVSSTSESGVMVDIWFPCTALKCSLISWFLSCVLSFLFFRLRMYFLFDLAGGFAVWRIW